MSTENELDSINCHYRSGSGISGFDIVLKDGTKTKLFGNYPAKDARSESVTIRPSERVGIIQARSDGNQVRQLNFISETCI